MSVTERTAEIGLLRAIGARRAQILELFLVEALVLAAAGGAAGLVLGLGLAGSLLVALPDLPVHPSGQYALLAELIAILVGLVAGVAPARRAARMQPLDALRAE